MPRPKVIDIPVPPNPYIKQRDNIKLTWDKKDTIVHKVSIIKRNYRKKVNALVLNNTKYVFDSFKTNHYGNKLNSDFERTFRCYFPTKESDILYIF